jgi:hypothetical protein
VPGANGYLLDQFLQDSKQQARRPPVLDAPLAMCDAHTVTPKDLVASELVYRDRRGETYNLTYNPAQRWFYAPEMRADEVLLLMCFDSRDDGAVSR